MTPEQEGELAEASSGAGRPFPKPVAVRRRVAEERLRDR